MKVIIKFANGYRGFCKKQWVESKTYDSANEALSAWVDRSCAIFDSAWKEQMIGKTEDFLMLLATEEETHEEVSFDRFSRMGEVSEVYSAVLNPDDSVEIRLYYSVR